jgi:predicted dehydrogenase
VSQNGYLLSRRGRSLPANASGFDTHHDPISSRFDCRFSGWQVIGELGEIRVSASGVGPGSVMLWSNAHPSGVDVSPPIPRDDGGVIMITDIYTKRTQPCSGYASTFGYELADFAMAVLQGKSPAVPVAGDGRSQPECGLGEMLIAQALYRSAAAGPQPHGGWEPVWPSGGIEGSSKMYEPC